MNGSEMQTLGGILILGGILCFVVAHFLLKMWKKRILLKLNENPNNVDYGGGST